MNFSSKKFEAVPRVSGLSRFATAPLFDSPLSGFQQIMIAHLEFIFFLKTGLIKTKGHIWVQTDELYP